MDQVKQLSTNTTNTTKPSSHNNIYQGQTDMEVYNNRGHNGHNTDKYRQRHNHRDQRHNGQHSHHGNRPHNRNDRHHNKLQYTKFHEIDNIAAT